MTTAPDATPATAVPPGPPEVAPGAGPAELLEHAELLLEHHDEQDRPAEAGGSWRRCRDVLMRARDLLERQGSSADPAALARARFLLGLTLSVGYWQAVGGNAQAYGIHDVPGTGRDSTALLALARATLPQDDPAYATACVRLGLLLHAQHEATLDTADDADDADEQEAAGTGVQHNDDDLDEALIAFEDGVPLLEDDPHPGLFVAYGCALADRYDRDREPDDLERAAAFLENVLDGLRPSGWQPAEDGAGSWADEADELETETRVRLVRLLQESPMAADTEEAHTHLELLAATLPDEHPSRIFAAGHLIDVYRERGGGRVRPEDRPAYLTRLRDLHRLLDPQGPYHPQAAAMLGAALAERDEIRPGAVLTAENEEAAGLLREALEGLAEDDELRPTSHALLGVLLNTLHERFPDRYSNDEALLHLERAVELFPTGDPMRSDLLNQLAHAAIVRDHGRRGDLAGVDRTIALLNESMRAPSASPGFGSQTHGAYASALSPAARAVPLVRRPGRGDPPSDGGVPADRGRRREPGGVPPEPGRLSLPALCGRRRPPGPGDRRPLHE
ncbi:hypothetical protein ACRJ4W_37515 [Streptomyces sp. GLT-R25]